MPPKPFPYPLQVGVDICNVNRLARIQRNENFRNLWARKVFTRLEWPYLVDRYRRARRLLMANAVIEESEKMRDHDGTVPWMLPGLPRGSLNFPSPDKTRPEDLENAPSAYMQLMRHLAGRYALSMHYQPCF